MGRKIVSVFLLVLVLCMMPLRAFAQDLDFNRVGSISVTLMDRDGKTPITGAELSLYYVATVGINNSNNLSYTFTDVFKDCGCGLDDPALSVKLDAFVQEHSVSAEKLVTDAHGNAAFTNLPLGLYFVKQTGAVAGYAPCTSFLVTVPSKSADGYVYDVPFPTTAPQEKSHVRNCRSKGHLAPLMRPTKFPEIPVSLERNTEVFRHPLL